MERKEESLIGYLIEYGLPITRKGKRLKLASEYAEKIAFYYEKRDPSLSNEYLCISNTILKSLLSNKGEI